MSRDSVPFDPRADEESADRGGDLRTASRQIAEQPQELPEGSRMRASPERAVRPNREDVSRPYLLRGRAFRLCDSELETMADLGRFRVVAVADLARFVYGEAARMEQDLRHLKRQGLVLDETLPCSGRSSVRVAALTKTGKRLLRETKHLDGAQALFHGIVKVREAKHDTELYGLFHEEASRIERDGGQRLRVILDYELKRDLNRERALLGKRAANPQEIEGLAQRHHLAVVNGKIPLPDLRIEYQTAEYEIRRVDLELATRYYHPREVAEKAQAGFALYSPRQDAPRLRRILDRHEPGTRLSLL